jgi:methyl-accepting chemotaxis protein
MKNWTIGKRLVFGFGVLMVTIAALGVFSVTRLFSVERIARSIAGDNLPGITLAAKMQESALQNEALALQHTLSEDKAQMASIEEKMAKAAAENTDAGDKYEKTIFTTEDRQTYDVVKKTREVMRAARQKLVEYSRSHTAAESAKVFYADFAPAQDKFTAAVQSLVDLNASQGASNGAAITATVTGATWSITIGLLVAFICGAGIAFYIVRSTNGVLGASVSALTEGSEQVVSAAGQVATSAQSLSQGATEQAASLEETSASMEEMASMARKNSENTQEAAGLMAEVDKRVNDSNQSLNAMVASMAAIQESSNKVAKIIKTIDEIAFQTNILALNAAVEAARAGEAGMGFAVVADEVRNLAQRSAQAAKDTAGLIEESITRSKEGSTKVEQVASSIGSITESVTRVKGIVNEVREASHQQNQGIDQVAQAIAQMEKVTQTTAATAEESAAASEELNAQAESSMGVVRQLEALVGGAAGDPGARTFGKSPAKRAAGASKRGNVLPMAASPSKAPKAAEEEIPFGDTGTYGKF